MITRINANTNTHCKTNFKANLTTQAQRLIMDNAEHIDITKVQAFLADETTKHLTVHVLPYNSLSDVSGYQMAVKSDKYLLAQESLEDKDFIGFVKYRKIQDNFPVKMFTLPRINNEKKANLSLGNKPEVFQNNEFSDMFDLEKVKNFETEVIAPSHNAFVAKVAQSKKAFEALTNLFQNDEKAQAKFPNHMEMLEKIKKYADKGDLADKHIEVVKDLTKNTGSQTKIHFVREVEPTMGAADEFEFHVSSDKYPKAGTIKIASCSVYYDKKLIDSIFDMSSNKVNMTVDSNLNKAQKQAELKEIFSK